MVKTLQLIRAIFGTPIVLFGLLIILIGSAIGGPMVQEAVYTAFHRRRRT